MPVAHEYDDMHHLVDRLPPDQVRRLLRLVRSDPTLAAYADKETATADCSGHDEGCQRLSIIDSVTGGPADLAERSEDYLREYFNNSL